MISNYKKLPTNGFLVFLPRTIKNCLHYVLHFLTEQHREGLALLSRIINDNKTWVHHYISESKRASMGWCKPVKKCLKKAKVGKSAGKLILLAHYVLKDVNVNSVYYCNILCKLKANFHRKWSSLRNEQIFFIHDNSHPVHGQTL